MISDQKFGCGSRPLTAVISGPVRLVYETVIEPMRRRARRRAGAWELARLDDRLLRDIGLTRSQAYAAAYGLVRAGEHSLVIPHQRLDRELKVVPLKPHTSPWLVDDATAAPPARRAARG